MYQNKTLYFKTKSELPSILVNWAEIKPNYPKHNFYDWNSTFSTFEGLLYCFLYRGGHNSKTPLKSNNNKNYKNNNKTYRINLSTDSAILACDRKIKSTDKKKNCFLCVHRSRSKENDWLRKNEQAKEYIWIA